MSEPRKHHLVPQFHLKQFADNKHRIIMVSRDQKNRVPTKVGTACRETDFYSVETEHGWSQDVERFLSEIEGNAATGIANMLKGEFPPRQEDRRAVALFVAFQCLRGNEFRAAYEQITDSIMKLSMANTSTGTIRKVFLQQEGREPTEEEIARQKAFMSATEKYKIVPHQNQSIRMMLEMAPRLANTILERKWFLMDHSEPCLLTSDSPVARWSDSKITQHYGIGWGTASELQMPLTPRHCLVMAWELPGKEQVYRLGSKMGPELAKGLNVSIAAYAFRWIFHHPATDPLKGVTLPPRPAPVTIDGL